MGQSLGHALIVEDNLLLNCLLREMVQSLGFSVTSATTAAQAMSAIDSNEFDVLVTDLRLDQEHSGLPLAREAIRRNRQIRVIIASGHPVPGELERTIGFLEKPFTVSQLQSAIQAPEPRHGA